MWEEKEYMRLAVAILIIIVAIIGFSFLNESI
jgi:hypothetical protein